MFTGWGGPFGTVTAFNRQVAGYVGLAGGIHFPRVGRGEIYLGAALHYLMLPVHIDKDMPDDTYKLNANHGGLVFGGVFARVGERVRFGAWGLLAGGGACLQNRQNGECRDRNGFFVGQPELFVHVVVQRHVALSLGAGFRFVAASAWSGPSSWALAGPVATLGILFGDFFKGRPEKKPGKKDR
ncbi:MAG: hypothetical protein R3A51_13120 [Nannocystaceae bacterium]